MERGTSGDLAFHTDRLTQRVAAPRETPYTRHTFARERLADECRLRSGLIDADDPGSQASATGIRAAH